jgi:DNA-binding transcriptional LysR family regulator
MPRFIVEDDIASGELRAIRIEFPRNLKPLMPMRVVYRADAPPGPAGRWLMIISTAAGGPGRRSSTSALSAHRI